MSYNLNRDQARQQVVSALKHKVVNGSSPEIPEGLSTQFQSIIELVSKSVDSDGNIDTMDVTQHGLNIKNEVIEASKKGFENFKEAFQIII